MATTLKTKNSVTTTVVPTTLQQGELAVNITDKKLWVGNAATTPVQLLGAGVTGDVVGPASATDNAVARFDATTGKLIQNSLVTVSDTGAISAPVDASISGLTVGKGGGAVASNTVVGNLAGANNSTGAQNVYIGQVAGFSATGSNNTIVGYASGYNTTGSTNTAMGWFSLYNNTSGASNSALGGNSLNSNTTGANNTALGTSALEKNTTASNNTAVGYQAGYSNTTGAINTAVGVQALYSNTTGSQNNAFGYQALYLTTTGNYNNAFGIEALEANTTGSSNTAMGDGALRANTTASYNTAVGYQALYSNTTANNNTAIGFGAGYSKTTGDGNAFIGNAAGRSATTGTLNTFVGGADSGYFVTTGGKNSILGCYNGNQGGLDIRTASNYIVLSDGDGNPRGVFDGSGRFMVGAVTWDYSNAGIGLSGNASEYSYFTRVSGYSVIINRKTTTGDMMNLTYNGSQVGYISTNGTGVTYGTVSDYRLKENILPMTGALDTVAQLNPVTYKWKETGDFSQGFIAHELAEVCPDAVVGEKDAIDENGKIKPQAIDTSFLVATLVSAIQELKAEVDSLKQQLGK
jgi:hypothetical protein